MRTFLLWAAALSASAVPAMAAGPAAVTRVYPVADLVAPCPQYGPDTGGTHLNVEPPALVAVERERAGGVARSLAELADLMTAGVAPESWADGGAVRLKEDTLGLVVRQTPEVHAKIAEFLSAIRRAWTGDVTLRTELVRVPQATAARWLGPDHAGRAVRANEVQAIRAADETPAESPVTESILLCTRDAARCRYPVELEEAAGGEAAAWFTVRPEIVGGVAVRLFAAAGLDPSADPTRTTLVADGGTAVFDVTPEGAASPVILRASAQDEEPDARDHRTLVLVTAELSPSGAVMPDSAAPDATDPADEIADAEEARLAAVLRKPMTVRFENLPLGQAASRIAGRAGINVVVDERGLADEGVSPETPVSLDAQALPLDRALGLLLDPLGLGHRIEDEVVKITSRPRSQGPQSVRIYSVAGLLPAGLAGPAPLDDEATAARREARQRALDDLAASLAESVAPSSWEAVGGWGAIRPNEPGLCLIVRQTETVHEELADRLERLRRERPEPTTLALRLLDLPATTAEELAARYAGRPLSADDAAAALRRAQADAKSKIVSLPPATLAGGQTAAFRHGDAAGSRVAWLRIGAGDARDGVVRLRATPGLDPAGTPVAAGESLLIDVTPPETGPGSPIILTAAQREPSAPPSRLLLLVTPRLSSAP